MRRDRERSGTTQQVPATVQHLGLDGAGRHRRVHENEVRPRGRVLPDGDEPPRLTESEREAGRSAGGHVHRLGELPERARALGRGRRGPRADKQPIRGLHEKGAVIRGNREERIQDVRNLARAGRREVLRAGDRLQRRDVLVAVVSVPEILDDELAVRSFRVRDGEVAHETARARDRRNDVSVWISDRHAGDVQPEEAALRGLEQAREAIGLPDAADGDRVRRARLQEERHRRLERPGRVVGKKAVLAADSRDGIERSARARVHAEDRVVVGRGRRADRVDPVGVRDRGREGIPDEASRRRLTTGRDLSLRVARENGRVAVVHDGPRVHACRGPGQRGRIDDERPGARRVRGCRLAPQHGGRKEKQEEKAERPESSHG